MTELTGIGYSGNILRVDLTGEKIRQEPLDEATVKKWVGGVGLGTKYLYDEVPPGVKWSDPQNRLIWTAGPLAGTGVDGAATVNIMAKGPMTNLAGSSQANGFFGAYLKFCGYDGIVFQGKAPHLVYLLLRRGTAEICDARHLKGKTVSEVEETLKKELGVRKYGASVYGIGPAGENLVRFSCLMTHKHRSAGRGGGGSVLGSKNLKAIGVLGTRKVNVADPQA